MDTSMVSIELLIPEDVYAALKDQGLSRKELGQRARHLLAVRFFQEKRLSLGKAARLAGLDRWRFIDLLSEHRVPVVDLDEEELAKEVAAVAALAQRLASQK